MSQPSTVPTRVQETRFVLDDQRGDRGGTYPWPSIHKTHFLVRINVGTPFRQRYANHL